LNLPLPQCDTWRAAPGARELLANTDMPAMASSASAGGDLGSGAPAPGPMAGEPPADVLFTLMSTGATLAADKLTLTGVSDVTLYSSSSRQTGVYQTGAQPGLR